MLPSGCGGARDHESGWCVSHRAQMPKCEREHVEGKLKEASNKLGKLGRKFRALTLQIVQDSRKSCRLIVSHHHSILSVTQSLGVALVMEHDDGITYQSMLSKVVLQWLHATGVLSKTPTKKNRKIKD